MADILIRMEMPKDCYTCSFRTTVGLDEWMCMVNKMRFPSLESGWNGDTYRHENCPLQELPEHGNLIDADSLADDLLYDAELAARALDDTYFVGKEREYAQSERDIKQNCAYYVSHAPVIILSNKEATE